MIGDKKAIFGSNVHCRRKDDSSLLFFFGNEFIYFMETTGLSEVEIETEA